MAFLAATFTSNIPIFGVWISAGIGLAISFGKSTLLMYILSSIVFIGLSVAFKFRRFEQNVETGIKLFLSVLLVGMVSYIGKPFLLYDTLALIMSSICTVIFYVIFSNAIPAIFERKTRKVFSKEELIGISILLVLSIAALGDFSVYGFSVRIVLSILIVLILGWKNGAAVRCNCRS